eukprot:gb/GECG01010335.1/.p1 GENE.gb/GECG01010335.1/~~gb/GECG01010335.1/.p1  ORF type:complete len:484 (+),score=51.91 gb/GECG01010335.1/:1-1452(+)
MNSFIQMHGITYFLIVYMQLLQNLRNRGSELLVRQEGPEKVIPDLARLVNASTVHFHRETCSEELSTVNAVRKGLGSMEVREYWGNTLYDIQDLPWNPTDNNFPDVYTQFRKGVESKCRVQEPYGVPRFCPTPELEENSTHIWGSIPEAASIALPGVYSVRGKRHLSSPPAQGCPDGRSSLKFIGGEDHALDRVNEYIWKTESIKTYKETRNGFKGANYSSKFSPWLAMGCISPRTIFKELKEYEATRCKNKSTYWLGFELIWRDFFRFASLKWGNSLFQLSGPRGNTEKHGYETWRHDTDLIQAWCEGRTGFPIIDANMRELGHTGFMSNRGRQIVASFFVKDMEQDWRIGAAWFESLLLDHDPTSNYGNWTYVAGVGADPRENRYFLVPKQSSKFDKNADYIRVWVPEVASWPLSSVHNPPQSSFPTSDYPVPTVRLLASRSSSHGKRHGQATKDNTIPNANQRGGSGRKKRVQHLMTDFM